MSSTSVSAALARWARRVGLEGVVLTPESANRLDQILSDRTLGPRPSIECRELPTGRISEFEVLEPR